MAPNYGRTLTKHRKAKKGHGWKKTGEDWNGNLVVIRVHFKNAGPLFFQIYGVSLYMYQNVIYTAGKSPSIVMWP